MSAFIITLIVGIVCIFIGVSNMRGNISLIHSYHRSRVSEQDKLSFGKRVGLGTIIIGCAIVLFSILSVITLLKDNEIFCVMGSAVLIAGIVVGLIISFSAMIKYNKGIF